MIESTRRRVLDGLNRRYIYGRVVCSFDPRQKGHAYLLV